MQLAAGLQYNVVLAYKEPQRLNKTCSLYKMFLWLIGIDIDIAIKLSERNLENHFVISKILLSECHITEFH